MTKSDEALTAFKSGFTCSSAVVLPFSDELGLDSEIAKKIAYGSVLESQRAAIYVEPYPERSW